VASDLPGYRRVALPEVHALLTQPGDTAALAAALKRVLEDADLARALTAQGTARAEEFSMRSLADHYVARYQALVDEAAAEAAEGRSGARVPAWVRRIMTPS
jgi:glycosyltransferase involved in cell wall biosynthesis